MSDMSDEEPMDVEEEDKLSTDKTEGDICGDGSILKEILVAGSGWEKPRSGAEVTVHYTGTLLSGEKFDSSVDRGDPFVFTIGKGQVIKGWDQGVATMLKGEKAKFTIVADKAYGSRGSPPKIPPNATLVFEVELISFTMFKDVSKNKDGSIMKKIIADSSEYKTPDDLSPVTLQITIKLEDGTVLKDTTGGEPWSFTIDDGSAFEELETAVKTMKQAEEAEFVIKTKNAFNPLSVPENATLNVVAKLVKFDKEDKWSMSNEDKLKKCDTVKELGNDLFKKGDFARAIRRYNTALEYLSSDHNFDDKEKSLAKEKKVSCRLNLAQCQLKQKAFKASLESCDEALKLDAVNIKALYRRGLANTEIGEWFAAEKDFKQVLEQDSKNTAAQQALRDLKKRQAEQDAKEKKLYKGMFDKLSKPAPAAAASAPAPAAAAAAAPAAASETAPMSE